MFSRDHSPCQGPKHRALSLFAGILGLDLGLRPFGPQVLNSILGFVQLSGSGVSGVMRQRATQVC